jgi:parvulin-like peptidyl-prolyl isomerase
MSERKSQVKNVYEQMEEQNARENVAAFLQKQALPYEAKKTAAKQRVLEYYHEMCDVRNANVHVSVGGLDSITLFIFIRDYCHLDVPGISASILEDKSVQAVHKQLGIEDVKPIKSKVAVIKEFGFPILSKEIATKIELLQNPTEDNKTVRHAIITGETGEYGGWQKDSRMKLSQRWLKLFGGYENENEGVNYGKPDFKVSAKCCYY